MTDGTRSLGPVGATVLVTGGAGFIGGHLVDALVDSNEVRVLDDFSSGRHEHVHPDAEVYDGSLSDDELLASAADGVDVVFHEAAIVSVQQSIDDPRRSHEVNVRGTLSVLEAARREGTRVVLASSAAIYGQPEYVPIDEAHPLKPLSPYGFEKVAVDEYARLYHDLYGLETVSLRYFNVYGPRQTGGDYSGVITIFLEQAAAGEPITVNGDGTQTRDFVHISDVVRANLLAAETDAVGESFNVGTGDTVSIASLAETIRDVVDSPSDIVHTEPRAGDIQDSQAEISKARAQLEYEPKVGLEEGLRALVGDSPDSAK